MKAYIIIVIYEEIILDAYNLFGSFFPGLKKVAKKIKKQRQDKYLEDLDRRAKKFIRNSTFIDKKYKSIMEGVLSGKLLWIN